MLNNGPFSGYHFTHVSFFPLFFVLQAYLFRQMAVNFSVCDLQLIDLEIRTESLIVGRIIMARNVAPILILHR